VRAHFPHENPLGKSITVGMQQGDPYGEIIGVTGDVKEGSLDTQPTPTTYFIHARLPYAAMIVVIRTQQDPMSTVGPVRRIMHDLDPSLPVADVRRMETVLGETYGRQRFSAILFGGFSLSAMLLAAIGIYGVLAYSVAERTREIGVRLAIGANPGRIVRMVLGDGARMVVAGFAVGMVGAFAVSEALAGMLYEVPARDPFSFTIAPAILLMVALLAAWIPARRAARLDPISALRVE